MLQALLQEVRSLDTSRKSLRSFGLLVGGLLTLLGCWLIWRSESLGLLLEGRLRPDAALVITGLALVVVGIASPLLLRPLYYIWMALAIALGAVMTRVVLSLVFVMLIVPIGLVMKLAGRDTLHRRHDASLRSYWISRNDMDRSPDRLEKYY
ncbi:MAG: SxtJ family membrane protein [Rhodothermales bacterium]|jgi:hypothetical protein